MFLGVDVGGTNSDAVVLSEAKEVIAWAKVTTTDDVTSGVQEVVTKVLGKLQGPDEKRRIKRICIGDVFLAKGGFNVDGNPSEDICQTEIIEICEKLKRSGCKNIVVSGIYSPINPSQEETVASIIKSQLPAASVTTSNSIGHMGLLERENAAILNESLKPLCQWTLQGLANSMRDIGLNCPIFLTQNDGTIASLEWCLDYPVCTFASGQTNSMRGAAVLAAGEGAEKCGNLKNAIVVDIGGTSTDVGQLCNWFPRQAANKVEIGGVQTNFRMPELYSIGFGGGSIVNISSNGKFTFGPLSVGNRLLEEGKSFGGPILTATDIAIKSGFLPNFGSKEKVELNDREIEKALETMELVVSKAIDRIKISPDPIPCILVGGGAALVKKLREMPGVSDVIFPKNYQVANAVGAALSQVSGTYHKVVSNVDRNEAVKLAKNEAHTKAVRAGALSNTIQIVEMNEVPLSYLQGNAMSYFVKAVGELDPEITFETSKTALTVLQKSLNTDFMKNRLSESVTAQRKDAVKLFQEPFHDSSRDEWVLDAYDIEAIAIGAGVLGCGGGGSSYLAKVRALQSLKEGHKIRIIKPSSDASEQWTVPVAFMGAPTVIIEKLMSGLETLSAVNIIQDASKIRANSLMCCEIGGCNAIEPLVLAARLNLPVVDADGMGRAFPELQMFIPFIFDHKPTPAVLVDEKGLAITLEGCQSAKKVEEIFRLNVVNFMGCSAAIAFNPLDSRELSKKCVIGSYTKAWHIGNSILKAKEAKQDILEAIASTHGVSVFGSGKITDLSRKTEGGFNKGQIRIELFEDDDELEVDFQNENLVVKRLSNDDKHVLATTPHLISLIEMESGLPLQTEDLRFGLRVAVVSLKAPDILLAAKALEVVGPRAFGYDLEVVYP